MGIEGIGFDASFLLESIPLGFPTDRERVEGGRLDFEDSQFEKELILWGVRWDVASPISYRQ